MNFEKNNIKLPFKIISLEITRKCNMKCQHCMRGEAQEKSLNKKVIDRFLDEVGTIQHLLLTGGEPLLEPEIIKYLVDEIIKRKIRIITWSCITNGSICNDEIINSFNKLSDYIATELGELYTKKGLRNIGSIGISNDEFHAKVDVDKTVHFYRKRANKHIVIAKGNQEDIITIVASGNAIKNHLTDNNSRDIIYHICPYRITIKDNMIDNDIAVTCDGNVTYGGDNSYKHIDSNIFGNIINEHLSDILLHNCHNQMFTEEEAYHYDYVYSSLKQKKFLDGWTEKDYKEVLDYFDIVHEKRVKMTLLFPFLKYDEVVKLAYDVMNLSRAKIGHIHHKIVCIDSWNIYINSFEKSLEYYNKIKRLAIQKDPIDFAKNYFKISMMDVEKISEKYHVI